MYVLRNKKTGSGVRNRMKKQRKFFNFRGFFKKTARVVGVITIVSLAVVLGYELYGVVVRTTFLRLDRIEVNPLKRLKRDDVVALAGVKPGDDMFALRLDRVGEQLMKSPWVEKVKVKRYFPHTLAIEIAERDPVAIINMGYLYYVDKKGEVFKPLNDGDSLDYPVLTGIYEEDMVKDPGSSREALNRALGLMEMLRSGSGPALAEISEIHFDKGYGFTLFTMNGGVPVKLGNTCFVEKLARLSRIYKELQTQLPTLEYIDLDYSDKIIVKKA